MNASVKLCALVGLFLLNVAVQTPCSGQGLASVVLNELMASNSATVRDLQGEYDDWIELHNPGRHPVNLAGMYLADDRTTPTQWRFPSGDPSATTIPAGGYLLVWADGDVLDGGLHASFELNADDDALYLFGTDGQTLIDSVEYGQQVSDVSFGRYPDATGQWRFISIPTPGQANAEAYEGVVADTKFSFDRGFYDEPFELTITCATPGSSIYCTFDGSWPYSEERQGFSGVLYTGPIRIDKTTCVRAVACKDGWLSSDVDTQTYIFLSDAMAQPRYPSGFPTNWKGFPADYEMDPEIVNDPYYGGALEEALLSLPSMSLVMSRTDLFDAGTGIYVNPEGAGVSWERPGSIELIYPDGRRGFQANCGVRIQGGWFRALDRASKNSFRLLFKGIYGDTKLRYPLFGPEAADTFDQVTLRAGANDGYTWAGNEQYAQFTRDQFARDLQLATGNAAPHGRFVHLYVNGLYWGLYNPCERPDASFSASYYGGEKEDWDAFRHQGLALSQGDRVALNDMLSQSREAADSFEAYQRLQGKNPDGTKNPAYPCLLDVSNYIDYMIINMWAGNWDWPWNNYWFGRNRTPDSTGFKFYCWDAEDIMLSSRSPLSMDKITNPDSRDVGQIHGSLRRNPEYQLLFADRLHRLFYNDGILTVDALLDRYLELTETIEMAIIAESARWGDMHRSRPATQEEWYSMRETILETYLPQRSDRVIGQFRAAGLYPGVASPVFFIDGSRQHGGHVATGAALAIQGASGTVWYTSDGTDPRVSDDVTAGAGGNGLLVAEADAKRVLVPTGPVDDAWRGDVDFDDSDWISGTGGIGYERGTGYEAFFDIDVQDQMVGQNTSCYIRIPFEISEPETLNAGTLSIELRYDDGFVAYLNGSEIARRNFDGQPAWDSSASAQHSDVDAIGLEPIDVTPYVSQLRLGRNMLAVHALNESLGSSDMLLSVLLRTATASSGGTGSVSSAAVAYSDPVSLSKSVQIKARTLQGTDWSALNETSYAVGPVAESLRISEIMYHPIDQGHPDDPNTEYVELVNIGAEAINLGFVAFTDGVDYVFGDIELPPGHYALVVKDVAAFEAKYGPDMPVVGQYGGMLSNGGERVRLQDAAGQTIHDFSYDDAWYDSTDGAGYSLTVWDPYQANPAPLGDKSTWRPSAHIDGSPGYDDSAEVGDMPG